MTIEETESTTRLNKFLALQLGLSRRVIDDMISAGRIKVNSEVAILGGRIDPTQDVLQVDGVAVNVSQQTNYQYIMFNKPVGYICSRRRQGDTPTIYELLPPEYDSLKPVGRLDKDSSGILLLTNDGDFAHHMTHPRFHKTKTYEVCIDKTLEPLHRQMISDYGISLEDGTSKLDLERIEDSDDTKWRVKMHEGRNRQIRRTFAALGYQVTALHRTNFGPYSDSDLSIGASKVFTITQSFETPAS